PVEPPDPVDPDPADPAPTAPGDDGSAALDASLRVVNDWGSGAVIELDITNTSQSQVSGGWQVQFGFDTDQITGSWNSSWSASAGGSEIVVSDVGWNSSLNAGQTVSVGFQINQGGLDEDRLNDEAAFLFV
ncbi:MAG: cellulose binding domain-containing protein, partial [Pseudomonadota bacterium]